jgi:hypothetical protein
MLMTEFQGVTLATRLRWLRHPVGAPGINLGDVRTLAWSALRLL